MKGIHRTPSLPADGQLDYLVNLIPHDGELRPIPATEQLADTLQEGDVLLCVHHTNADVPGHRRHLIVKTTGGSSHVLACYDADGHRSVIATLSTTINAVQPAGNVLVISCGDEASRQTMYAVFSPRHDTAATESGYAFVGAAFPSLDLQFQLRNTFVQTFAKGEDTGIVLEENAAAKTVDFTQTVPLSPQQVELWRSLSGSAKKMERSNMPPWDSDAHLRWPSQPLLMGSSRPCASSSTEKTTTMPSNSRFSAEQVRKRDSCWPTHQRTSRR